MMILITLIITVSWYAVGCDAFIKNDIPPPINGNAWYQLVLDVIQGVWMLTFWPYYISKRTNK